MHPERHRAELLKTTKAAVVRRGVTAFGIVVGNLDIGAVLFDFFVAVRRRGYF
jgi:hypothetical protein